MDNPSHTHKHYKLTIYAIKEDLKVYKIDDAIKVTSSETFINQILCMSYGLTFINR